MSEDTPSLPPSDVTTKLYETARLEIIQRIRYRDYALMFYIASVGAYLAFASKELFEIKTCSDDEILRALLIASPLPWSASLIRCQV